VFKGEITVCGLLTLIVPVRFVIALKKFAYHLMQLLYDNIQPAAQHICLSKVETPKRIHKHSSSADQKSTSM
jgi:hypothetical protein